MLGTSVNFSSSSEPSEKIFEPSRARAISQEMIFEPSRARAEKASSAFEREQNRASINHFSSMIFCSISSIVEQNSSGNRANPERKSSINQKPVQFLSKKHNWFLWKHSSSLRTEFRPEILWNQSKNAKYLVAAKNTRYSMSIQMMFSSFWMCIFNPG